MTGLFTICALGFVLGVRHAADADHVVAISTIVARHRSVRGAALIGALWGVGHTLTVLLVGGAIILFRWVIPPRVDPPISRRSSSASAPTRVRHRTTAPRVSGTITRRCGGSTRSSG